MFSISKVLKAAAIAIPMGLASMSAQATTVSSGSNNPLAFSWSFATPTNPSRNLTGTGSMTISGFNSSSLTIVVTLNNTAPTLGQGGDRLTQFGFGIDPNATGISFSDPGDSTGMVGAALNNIPSIATIEVCAYGGNNCSGGSNGGIFANGSDTFTITLTGTWGSSVNIAPIGFKYQTGTGSNEFTTGSSTTTTTTSTTGTPSTSGGVPAPASTLTLLGLGLLGMGYARRMKSAR
jgi:hypothetical protein